VKAQPLQQQQEETFEIKTLKKAANNNGR